MIINSKFRSLIFFFQFKIFYNEFKKNNKNRQQTTAVIHPLYNRQQQSFIHCTTDNRQQQSFIHCTTDNRQQQSFIHCTTDNRQQQSFIHCTTDNSSHSSTVQQVCLTFRNNYAYILKSKTYVGCINRV
jgi:hypothetical protein